MSQKKLHGIFTPNMVPLDGRGRINERELRRIVDWLIDNGISGLYPNGSTGEFTRFSFEERKEIVRICCEQRDVHRRDAGATPVFVLAGAAEANVDTTVEAAAYYHSLGADAVAIVAPFYYKLSQEGVYAYFSEIARQSPIDLTLYNIPQFANDISNDTIKRLAAEYPRIIGIKDSSRDLPRLINMMNEITPIRPEFVFLVGCEEMLLPAIMMGADGGTVATSGVVPEVVMKLYDLTKAGRYDEARTIQYSLLELIKLIVFGADFPEGVRQAVALRGFDMGEGRQPLSPTQKFSVEEVRRTIHCVLNALGLTDQPVGGCTPKGNVSHAAIQGPDRALIERIASEVLQNLGAASRR